MNQQNNEKKKTAPLCLGFTQKGDPCKRKGCEKYKGFCASHNPAETLPRCYYNFAMEEMGRCSNKCRKGKIYCVEHKDFTPSVDWCRDTPFKDCETSLKFVEFMRDYVIRGGVCSIEKRYDALENAERAEYYKADLKKLNETLTEYMKFASVKYPIQYGEASVCLTEIGYRCRKQMLKMMDYKKVRLNTMNMSGENDAYEIMVKIEKEMYYIKEHIIKDKYGGATETFNIALFKEGQEDEVETWTNEMEGETFFCLASAENARPLEIKPRSYKEGMRVLYNAGYGGNFDLCFGIVKSSTMFVVNIERVKEDKLPNSKRVFWDTPLHTLSDNSYNRVRSFNSRKILDCGNWRSNPIYEDGEEWVEGEDLPNINNNGI